jgi:hypothetical protein
LCEGHGEDHGKNQSISYCWDSGRGSK